MTTTFRYEPLREQQYGGPTWVEVLVDDVLVARVNWVNGAPYLSVQTLADMEYERAVRRQVMEHNNEISRRATEERHRS